MLKVSEVIRELTKFLEEHGDLNCKIYNYGCGGHYNCEPNRGVDEVVYCSGDTCGEPHAQIESE